jgi:hypothetical protein
MPMSEGLKHRLARLSPLMDWLSTRSCFRGETRPAFLIQCATRPCNRGPDREGDYPGALVSELLYYAARCAPSTRWLSMH